jgi:hypothetical protein
MKPIDSECCRVNMGLMPGNDLTHQFCGAGIHHMKKCQACQLRRCGVVAIQGDMYCDVRSYFRGHIAVV